MKLMYSLLVIFLMSSMLKAQTNSINYKALIKDDLGNVAANQQVTIQFQILENGTTNVYQETHTPTTDTNGIIVVNIGEGTVDSGNYTSVDWASAEHFLNVQVNIGSGLVDLGSTQFMAVPYALSAGNVSGLETLDEGNGNGWRLKGQNSANYGNIGNKAVDLSQSTVTSNTQGATGVYSFAAGRDNTASGLNSVAIGLENNATDNAAVAMGGFANATNNYSISLGRSTTASGDSSVALGSATTATNVGSIAMGSGTQATGRSATATGRFTRAQAYSGFALGRYNLGNGSSNSWIETDPLFEIGNGTDDTNRANALTVLKNGKVDITGDLTINNTTTIGSSGVAISEVIKITGVTSGAQGVGSNTIPYPAGYNWENTHVVSFKVKSRVPGLGGVNKYTSLGNYNAGDDNSIYIDLGFEPNLNNTPFIKLNISDPQYFAAEYVLILMKIE